MIIQYRPTLIDYLDIFECGDVVSNENTIIDRGDITSVFNYSLYNLKQSKPSRWSNHCFLKKYKSDIYTLFLEVIYEYTVFFADIHQISSFIRF